MLNSLMIFCSITYLPATIYYNYNYDSNYKFIKPTKVINKMYFYWNIMLAVFSIWGTINTMPYLVRYLFSNGIILTVINNNLWEHTTIPCLLFAPSKIVELGDTIFLMLRGKKIRFIQYFHHWLTMLYCWHAYYYVNSGININMIFCSINYTVHAFMYTWYAVSAYGIVTSKWIKNMITTMQVAQMYIGMYIIIIAQVYGKWYLSDFYGSIYATLMYSSYCFLFSKFLIKGLKNGDIKLKV